MKEIVIPSLGESIQEAQIAKWYKAPGANVKVDEILLEIETEKVTMEVCAPCSGVIAQITKEQGQTVQVGQVVGLIKEGSYEGSTKEQENLATESQKSLAQSPFRELSSSLSLSPAVRKIAAENNLSPSQIQGQIQGTAKGGRISKMDIIEGLTSKSSSNSTSSALGTLPSINIAEQTNGANIMRVKMSRLRKTIAQRLKDSQNTAAILTTFNEIDMFKVIELRQRYKEDFEKRHQVKLGFMSFFVKAVVNALQEIPSINAEIDGDDIIYKNYYDIGVAVGTQQGLVVPVLRGANNLSFAEIEIEIASLGKKARDNKLSMTDLTGGTFSISNGGTYGSLLSTPIINPPQSGILGMHKIQERAVVVSGQIQVRPMMYVALSYDHRLVDGKEAVTFLVRVKDAIENPERLLLDL
jgi:2-oxoglutarate dehydrogenase E2 component (dihydrolipoamide succinyltransferase)